MTLIPTIMAFLMMFSMASGEVRVEWEVKRHIEWVAEMQNIPVNLMLGICICESELNVDAYNPVDTDGLPKYGLFQFAEKTFYGFGGRNIHNWREQIEIAGYMMGQGWYYHWPTCFAKTLKNINEYNSLGR